MTGRATAVLLFVVGGVLEAHETRPCYLELAETAPGTWRMLWKVPARGDLRLAVRPAFPDDGRWLSDPLTLSTGEFFSERRTLACALEGRTIAFDGLQATRTDVLVRVVRRDGTVLTALVKPEDPVFVLEGRAGLAAVATAYFRLGVEHILLGVDHLLFVLALVMLVRGGRRLVGAVTAFTAAHSLTLAASVLGYVRVPSPPVEAVIALSIVFVAREIASRREGRPGLTERKPWIAAFGFGLLHGLGFAGALSEVGVPPGAVPAALLFFNLGVEAGQLLFIGGLLAAAAGARRAAIRMPGWLPRASAYALGGLAVCWTLERIAAFGS